jgi:hypothetical protein
MMSTLAELQRQKAELEKQIETAKKNERAEALKTVKKLCKEFGFTAAKRKLTSEN